MEIANRRETFVYSGSGMNRPDTGGDIPDMFLRAERGIHCENQRRWMSFFGCLQVRIRDSAHEPAYPVFRKYGYFSSDVWKAADRSEDQDCRL